MNPDNHTLLDNDGTDTGDDMPFCLESTGGAHTVMRPFWRETDKTTRGDQGRATAKE